MKKKSVRKDKRNFYYAALIILIFLLVLMLGAYSARNALDENGLPSANIITEADGLLFDLSLAFEDANVDDTVYILIITALLVLIFLVIYLIIQERKHHVVVSR